MNRTKLAHITSWVLHPFALPIYVLYIIFWGTTMFYQIKIEIATIIIVALYTITIPIMTLAVRRLLGYITNHKIDLQQEPTIPLFIGFICYTICAITIARVTGSSLIFRLLVAASACQFICLVVTSYWKISLHMTIMGAAIAMLILLNLVNRGELTTIFAISVLASGILATSQLYLGRHTGKQVLVGFCGGFITTVMVFLFI